MLLLGRNELLGCVTAECLVLCLLNLTKVITVSIIFICIKLNCSFLYIFRLYYTLWKDLEETVCLYVKQPSSSVVF